MFDKMISNFSSGSNSVANELILEQLLLKLLFFYNSTYDSERLVRSQLNVLHMHINFLVDFKISNMDLL